MFKRGLVFGILFLFVVAVIGCSGGGSAVFAPKQGLLSKLQSSAYVNNEKGFSMQAPKDWKLDASNQYGDAIFFFNNLVDNAGQASFTANINIKATAVPEEVGLDEYVAGVKESVIANKESYKLLSDKRVKLETGKEAHLFYVQISKSGITVNSLQLLTVGPGRVYVATGTALGSKWESNYKELIETSLATFKAL